MRRRVAAWIVVVAFVLGMAGLLLMRRPPRRCASIAAPVAGAAITATNSLVPVLVSSHPQPVPVALEVVRPSPVAPVAAPHGDSLRTVRALVLNPAVQAVIGLDSAVKGYEDRDAALGRLTRGMEGADVAALLAFLEVRPGEQPDVTADELHVLKNDVADVLLRQDRRAAGLGELLAAMYRDRSHAEVWRDYCIQYLAAYYDQTWPARDGTASAAATHEGGSAEYETVLAALWEATAEKQTTIAGTALLGLENLSRQRPALDVERIAEAAEALSDDPAVAEATRITAIRLCGLMKRKAALPTARILAQVGETVPLRMAGLATVGELGTEEDEALLRLLALDGEKRIRVLAETLLKKPKDGPHGAVVRGDEGAG